jgi:hypothetical protein
MATIQQGFLKRSGLLLGALGLLVLSGALMMRPGAAREQRQELPFPRYPRERDLERQRQRNTLLLPRESPASTPPSSAPALAVPEPQAPEAADAIRADPLHVALAGEPLGLVVEAAALKDSRLGRMLLACLTPELSGELTELEQKTGLRPLEQVERIAIAGKPEDPVVILSGQVGGFEASSLGADVHFEPHGAQGLLAESSGQAVALWQEQLLLIGRPQPVRAVLERLEGKPSAGGELAGEAYGELYGTLSGPGVSELLPRELRERFATAAERVTLHVDARDDLLLVADVYGAQQPLLADLAKSIGGAFALGRLHAAREDNPLLADLLDQSRVIPGDGSFQVEMALPVATIAEQLGECARNGSQEP